MSRYVVPGIVIIAIIAISALYLSQESPGGLADSPQIIEDVDFSLSLNNTVSPLETISIDSVEYFIDEEGTKHYSLTASDSPMPGK